MITYLFGGNGYGNGCGSIMYGGIGLWNESNNKIQTVYNLIHWNQKAFGAQKGMQTRCEPIQKAQTTGQRVFLAVELVSVENGSLVC